MSRAWLTTLICNWMRPSIGRSPVYYYFISNFITFPQTDTLVLMDCRIGHPWMMILQIQMTSRIGWTILTPFVLPYSMIGYCLLLPCHAPLIWGFVSLACHPPFTQHQVASSFYPFLCQSLLSHILLSFTPLFPSPSLSRTLLLYVPRSTKAIAREARIRLIWGFLKTHARPANLSDTEFHSLVNSVMKIFLLHGSLWHWEPHGRHQLVVSEHRRFGLIKEAHNDLRHKGVFTVQTRLLLHFWWPMLVKDVKWFV